LAEKGSELMSDYDLAVAYRIYPGVSKVPPVFSQDKYKLSELCLKSFKDSLVDLKTKMYVLLDNCPPEYQQLFEKYFQSSDIEFIHLDGVGNQATFDLQIKTLLKQEDSERVYFAEDDYFYLPGQFKEMIDFMDENSDADFLSTYDHRDYYTHPLHRHAYEKRTTTTRLWRTANSTCLTFLTTKKILKEARSILETYTRGNYDSSMWLALTKYQINPINMRKSNEMKKIIFRVWRDSWRQIIAGKRFKLWTPLPSISTHMENNSIAPGIDWKKIMALESLIIDPNWDEGDFKFLDDIKE
jgi:hypothetical protein